MLFFGVQKAGGAGHYLFNNVFGRTGLSKIEHELISMRIDTGFCPAHNKEQGKAKMTHTHGYTIVAFWDYTGDSRPGSCGNFIEYGYFGFPDMMRIAALEFPSILNRVGDIDLIQSDS